MTKSVFHFNESGLSIEALFTLTTEIHLGHRWTALYTAVTEPKSWDADHLKTVD